MFLVGYYYSCFSGVRQANTNQNSNFNSSTCLKIRPHCNDLAWNALYNTCTRYSISIYLTRARSKLYKIKSSN